MTTQSQFTPPKKKRNILWWIGGLFASLFLLLALQRLPPSPPIVVSRQTTVVTAPLSPDGLPDYKTYELELARKGITTENNAAVLIWKALGTCGLEPIQYRLVAAELGLPEKPSGSTLQPLTDAGLEKRLGEILQTSNPTGEEPDVDSLLSRAVAHPWTRKLLPPLADWVDNNQAPLDLIVESTHRPQFYSPSPTLLDSKDIELIGVVMPGIEGVRKAARAVATRSMRYVGENRLDDAWLDILALHRLATLISQGPSIIDQLVAIAVRSMACQTTAAILCSKHLTKELANKIHHDLVVIEPFSRMADCVDQHERICALDTIIHAHRHGFQSLADPENSTSRSPPSTTASVDWNVILQTVNGAYDSAVAALRNSDHDARNKAFSRFESHIEAESKKARNPLSAVGAFFSRTKRSELIGSIINSLMLPALEATIAAEDRANSQLTLTQLCAALAVFRTEHGSYPEKVGDLVPGVIERLPTDLFHGNNFIYRRTDDGFLLYSTAENGKDDAGSSNMMQTYEGQSIEELDPGKSEELRSRIPTDADDFSVRLPILNMQLPAGTPN